MNTQGMENTMPATTTIADAAPVDVWTPRTPLGELGNRCSTPDCAEMPSHVLFESYPGGHGGLLRTRCGEHLAAALERVAPLDELTKVAAAPTRRGIPTYGACVQAHPYPVRLTP
jgi:hypothetical protein